MVRAARPQTPHQQQRTQLACNLACLQCPRNALCHLLGPTGWRLGIVASKVLIAVVIHIDHLGSTFRILSTMGPLSSSGFELAMSREVHSRKPSNFHCEKYFHGPSTGWSS